MADRFTIAFEEDDFAAEPEKKSTLVVAGTNVNAFPLLDRGGKVRRSKGKKGKEE